MSLPPSLSVYPSPLLSCPFSKIFDYLKRRGCYSPGKLFNPSSILLLLFLRRVTIKRGERKKEKKKGVVFCLPGVNRKENLLNYVKTNTENIPFFVGSRVGERGGRTTRNKTVSLSFFNLRVVEKLSSAQADMVVSSSLSVSFFSKFSPSLRCLSTTERPHLDITSIWSRGDQ